MAEPLSAAALTVAVALGARGYPIHIGRGLIERAGALIASATAARRVAVVTDRTVAALHLPRLEAALAAGGLAAPPAIVLPPGEATKSWEGLRQVTDALVGAGLDRGGVVIAFGGGVIGDLAGFAAAIALRGLDLVQIPTTLLAQVDSSVGGKTGIDTAHGKNMVGAFHQPRLVLADLDVLETLPDRELRAGYAEIVKYGLIDDAPFFAWLEEHGAAVLSGQGPARAEAVARSCAAKARVVAADEREGGLRALLNLGHTFGHAYEQAAGYDGRLLHGEAVSIGMVRAFRLSVALGLCPQADAARVEAHLAAQGLPVAPPAWLDADAEALIAAMRRDKKARDGRMTFILAHGIGRAFISREVTADALAPLLGAA